MTVHQAATGDRMLGERVRERRRALALSQAELAGRVSDLLREGQSVGQTYISQIERALIGTSVDKLRALATALETTVAYLLGEASASARPRPRPRSLGVAESGRTDTARRAGEQPAQPRAWR
ncbi:MAG: helix-turn-helix transcriptional regulator [Dehalococcoidia bacterium]